jgi:hypothetical protein
MMGDKRSGSTSNTMKTDVLVRELENITSNTWEHSRSDGTNME